MAGFFPTFFRQFWSSASRRVADHVSAGHGQCRGGPGDRPAGAAAGRDCGSRRTPQAHVAGFQPAGHRDDRRVVFRWPGAMAAGSVAVCAGLRWDSTAASCSTTRCCWTWRNRSELDRVSALGYALGYLGGGLLFALNVLMVVKPALFGLHAGRRRRALVVRDGGRLVAGVPAAPDALRARIAADRQRRMARAPGSPAGANWPPRRGNCARTRRCCSSCSPTGCTSTA